MYSVPGRSLRSLGILPVHKDSLDYVRAPGSLGFLPCATWKMRLEPLSFKINAAVQRPVRLWSSGNPGYCQEIWLPQWEKIAKAITPLDSFSCVSEFLYIIWVFLGVSGCWWQFTRMSITISALVKSKSKQKM